MTIYYQQGDCLFVKNDVVNLEKVTPLDSDIVIKGANNHTVVGGKVYSFEGKTYVASNDEAMAKHAEHKDINLPKGIYEIRAVREFDHFAEEARAVID